MESACIFASSKYYRQAYADASRISQPLGYNFLSKKQQSPIKKHEGSVVRKIMFDKPLVKAISLKNTLLQKLKQHLTVSDSKRKNTYLSSNPLSIINRTTQLTCQQLSEKYFPQLNKTLRQQLDFINTINSVADDVLYNINDYALSTYLICYYGRNGNVKKFIKDFMEDQFIQYDLKVISSFNVQNDKLTKQSQQFIDFEETNIKNKQKIDQYANRINKKGQQIDGMYSGYHLFIGDCMAPISNHQILKQQIDNLKYLQFYIYLLTSGVLGNGQNAIIKIRGTMRHKTIDYLFLFKLAFNKITIIKPAFSNYLSPQKYLLCQGYIKQNGQQIHQFLSNNFNTLYEYGQQKLLVNPQLIFREQTLADNIKNYNDSFITRGLKQILDLYLKNTNLSIYPPKTLLIEKLKTFNLTNQITQLIQKIEELVPTQQEINSQPNQQQKNRNKDLKSLEPEPIVQDKQPQLDLFESLRRAKQQIKPIQKQAQPAKKPKKDQQQELQDKLSQRFKQQQRIRQQKKKQKKQQQKKKKQKKQQDPYSYGNSHFSYSYD